MPEDQTEVPEQTPTGWRRFVRTISFRLNVWYGSIFLLTASLLFILLYYVLSTAIERKDREVLQARVKEYSAIYQSSGVQGLRQHLARQDATPSQRGLYVRLIDWRGKVVLLVVPEEWVAFNLEVLPFGIKRQTPYIRIPRDEERDFTFSRVQLFDRAILELGRSTNSRAMFLDPVRKLYFAITIPIFFLGLIGGAAFSGHVMRPIRDIIASMREIIQTGKLDARVSIRNTDDELDELAQLFNQMLGKNKGLIISMRESLDNVAHDLRTPLTRLRGVAELALRETPPESKASEALADCLEESERVLTILKTLLDVAEAEAGVMKLEKTEFNLCQLLAEVEELYSFVAEEKGIELKIECPENLAAWGDKIRLRQVFANLVDNAIKYTAKGHVQVRAESRNGQVKVIVRDTGMGIPAEEQERIWERLFRGDRSRSQRGLGLGLSLVRAIVIAHGGAVTVQSAPDEGSRFETTLPARPS